MTPPEEVVKWVLSIIIPAGGGLFLFLLRRTFNDFESRVSQVFDKLELALKEQQDHDTRLQLLGQRLENIEHMVEKLTAKIEAFYAIRPSPQNKP